jgi:hypothetical protein
MVCDNDLVDFQYELRDCEAEVDTLQICSRGMRGVSSRVVGVAGVKKRRLERLFTHVILPCLATGSRPRICPIRLSCTPHLTSSLT